MVWAEERRKISFLHYLNLWGLLATLLISVLVVLIIVLLLHLHDLHLGSGAQEWSQLTALFNFVENQLEFVGLDKIIWKQQFFAEIHQLFDQRRGKDWINDQSNSFYEYLNAFSSMVGMSLPRSGQDNSRQGLVLH